MCAALLVCSAVARTQPAERSGCGLLKLHSGGFASNINIVLLSVVVYPHTIFYIDDEHFSYKCWPQKGNWDKIFDGAVREKSQSSTENCTVYAFPNEPLLELHRLFNEKVINGYNAVFQEKGEALTKLWQLSRQSKRRSDAHVKFLRSLPRPLTAVQVRHGDKAIEDDHWRGPDQVYGPIDFARAAMSYPGARNGTCVIYGDDLHANQATAQQLVRLLRCYPIVMGGSSSGHVQADFNSKDVQERCSLAEHFVAELEGMAAADYFVGSMNSNIARLVALMRVHLNHLDEATARDVQSMQWHPY